VQFFSDKTAFLEKLGMEKLIANLINLKFSSKNFFQEKSKIIFPTGNRKFSL
jgi:hypothetical protein